MYLVMTLLACTLCLASYKLDRAEKEINVLYLRCSELEYRSFRVDEIQGMVYYLRDGLRQYLAYQALHNSGTSAHINNLWIGGISSLKNNSIFSVSLTNIINNYVAVALCPI